MAEAAEAKFCTLCGCDCTAIPRAKDRRGRYYCRPCYDKALAHVRAKATAGQAASAEGAAAPGRPAAPAKSRAAPPGGEVGAHPPRAAAVRPAPIAAAESDPFAELLAQEQKGTAVATERPCPSCGQPVAPGVTVCKGCGFNFVTRQKPGATASAPRAAAVERSSGGGGGGLSAILSNPTYVGLAQLCMMLVVVGAAFASPALARPCNGIAGLYGTGVSIWVLVTAFRQSIGTGFLCLCVWPYQVYFAFAKSGSAFLPWSYGSSLLGSVLTFIAVWQLPVVD